MTKERFVRPKVFRLGYTEIDEEGLRDYLEYTQNQDFMTSYDAAKKRGLSGAEILCSFYAKLCYRALTLGKNANVTRTRDIWDNLVNCFDTGHGSVFEHVQFNFGVVDCSRVFTHELVRHRIGVAYSQTSGRYCRLDHIPLVWDPILDPVKDFFEYGVATIEEVVYMAECELGLRMPNPKINAPAQAGLGRKDLPEIFDPEGDARRFLESWEGHDTPLEDFRWVPDDSFPFAKKKKITSAIRRIAPNGQANEIGFSVNLRALRHTMLMRTARFAEQEIRDVFGQIYDLIAGKFPLVFHGAKVEEVDGFREITGMKMQPYEKPAEMVLSELGKEALAYYLDTGKLPEAA